MIRSRAAKIGRVAEAVAFQQLPRTRSGQVLYNSFNGQFSDSPRAIYEELQERDGDRPHVWVSAGDEPHFPQSVRAVPLYSRDYLREVGRARYVVSNRQMPTNFQKKRGTTYLQTWHGTPLKRIAFDNDRWRANPSGLRKTARDFSRWDYLVSQNPYSTEIFRRAFRFEGEILEAGYPRNDALNAADRDQVRARVRRDLGIDDSTRAILYAPTWRDTLVDEEGKLGFSLALDMDRLSAALGDDHVVLLRLHYLIAAALGDEYGRLVRNVSSHPDIRELYLAADAFITDYSSAMFDFAVTGKPMALFTYDLEDYRDDVRGFYFELEEEAPGPLCVSTDEVVSALKDLEGIGKSYADRYERFRQRFCPLDDGQAGKRVVDRVFER